ncbi:hypothetical protein PIB30_008542 [Stylosanthes scabra]|uniref:Uncharacterized protein n=1 Tax=Stylosanthes scabra TaxID=79078 RepID=A0ABU6Z2P6_9FABA|nr:hypothetical protein [Stylosanthes scabra]
MSIASKGESDHRRMRSLGGNPTQAQLKAIIAEENLTAPFDFPRFLDLMAKHKKAEPFSKTQNRESNAKENSMCRKGGLLVDNKEARSPNWNTESKAKSVHVASDGSYGDRDSFERLPDVALIDWWNLSINRKGRHRSKGWNFRTRKHT